MNARTLIEAEWDEPAEPNERCPHCRGRGSIAVEPGSSPRYRCPDCRGTGKVQPAEEPKAE